MTTDNSKNRGLEVPLPEGNDTVPITREIYDKFEKILKQSETAGVKIDQAKTSLTPGSMSLKAMITAISNVFNGKIFGKNSIKNDVVNTLASGISKAKAKELFAQDIGQNEADVKEVLRNSGVTKIPQNVFDGLVSFQNQVGNIRYAYVKGEKIDLTGLYSTGEWDRVASFIAADERDRERRIREAALIAFNSYGPEINEDTVVKLGIENLDELIAKEILNEQTGEAATAQQIVAAANVFYDETGLLLPSLNYQLNTKIINEKLAEAIKTDQVGPWPY